MPIARPEPQNARVIAHVDMDCFYVQVEQRKNPELRGLPTAVVQYNSWKGGGLIAVGYEARKFGVKRSMRGDEAKRICPNIQLIQVPVARGKADLNLYRNAGSEVVSILATKGRCERASIDEVYLDLTDAAEMMLSETPPEVLEEIDEEVLKSHVLGLHVEGNEREENVKEWLRQSDADHQDKLLACGAIIVEQLRMKVLYETKFTCSAGIAHNKMLAKLASAMHKPAQQTVVPSSSVKDLLASLPVKKMKQLGGKLGSSLQTDLGVNTIGDLLQFSQEKLQEHYGVNTGTWLWNISRGISGDAVVDRLLPKSHGCGKTFPGPQALKTIASVENWVNQLCDELSDRIQSDLDQNRRIAHTLTLHARAFKENDMEPQRKFPSKSCPLRYGTAKIQEDAVKLFDSGLRDFLGSQHIGWGITSLSIAASKISDLPQGTCSILKFLQGKIPSSTSLSGAGEFHNESLPLSSTVMDQEIKQKALASEAASNDIDIIFQAKPLKRIGSSVGKTKDVRKSSILKFFQSSNSSFHTMNQACERSSLDQASSSSFPECEEHSDLEQIDEQVGFSEDRIDSDGHHNQTRNGYTWGINMENIDPSVLDELPMEIQREIREWFHPPKRANTSRKGSSIVHYFSPVKKG
ncbi:DNA polymerase eta-like isoform X1 [Musa acuminata AAA Group]|uniref:DNA polymerase eta-like isoform X1 n=2 Tax=Musa acuminata AAA Group TaxID=214697 RepID=UPI0031E1C4C6